MRYDEYRAQDGVGLARLVADGEVHPTELLQVALERYREVQPAINAVSLLMEDAGTAAAAKPPEGPFGGVPFLIKDLLQDYAGYPTSGGTGPLRSRSADQHSILVQRWIDAGLVIFGKTTTPEFGGTAITESRTFGVTRNPWDLDRTPGGSSGGSAAAVAAGIVPMAGGNDGGGSIRIPAACCGLFGLKPGRGLVPCGTNGGDYVHGAATEGILSRSVRDSAAMLDVISGSDPGARHPEHRCGRAYADAVHTPPRALRIGFTHESPVDTPVHPEAVRAVEQTAVLLESLGHHVEPAAPRIDGAQLGLDFLTVWMAHAAADLAEACRLAGARPADFDFDTRLMGAIGRGLSARSLVEAYGRWNTYARALADFHGAYDLLLTPTIAEPPGRVGSSMMPAALQTALSMLLKVGAGKVVPYTKSYRDFVFANMAPVPFTQLANLTGRPAMSVPVHRTSDGLPLGSQFVGGLGGEFLLLQLAAQLEAAQPWSHLQPPESALVSSNALSVT
ncbi:amidase [Nocardia sp. NPDC051052]|uniref:amidase n=1 Tax=Nocardia sp. NPDC051052 TaxID=3364322 RepID=UPI0037B32D3E